MKIKSLLTSLVLLTGLAFGQSQFSGGGGSGAKINGSPTAGNCASWLNATTLQDAGGVCGGAPPFSSITTGTSTTNLFVGTGGTLTTSGTGVINANQFNGAVGPVGAVAVATNGSSQLIAATTTGGGSTVVLSAGPALTGSTSAVTLTLTNPLGTLYGGTGINSSASTGVPTISAGTWTIGVTPNYPNSYLANSSITLNGTANQITSPGATSLGGTAVFALANPLTTPGPMTVNGNLTTNMTGGPFCVHETSGLLSATAADCGSGGGGFPTSVALYGTGFTGTAIGGASSTGTGIPNPLYSNLLTGGSYATDRGLAMHDAFVANTNSVSGDCVDARGELSTSIPIHTNMFPYISDFGNISGGCIYLPSGALKLDAAQYVYGNNLSIIGTGIGTGSGGKGPTTFQPSTAYSIQPSNNGSWDPFLLNWGVPAWANSTNGFPGPYSSFFKGGAQLNCASTEGVSGFSLFSGQDGTSIENLAATNCRVASMIGGSHASSNGMSWEHAYLVRNAGIACIANTAASGGTPWTTPSASVGSIPAWSISGAGLTIMSAPTGGLDANDTQLVLSQVANASGQTTVYTGTITGGGSNALAGQAVNIFGFANPLNNGYFIIRASTISTITVSNHLGVAVTAAGTAEITATASLQPGVGIVVGAYTDSNGTHGSNVGNGGTHSTNINGVHIVGAVSDVAVPTAVTWSAGTPVSGIGEAVVTAANDFAFDFQAQTSSAPCSVGNLASNPFTNGTTCTGNALVYFSGFTGTFAFLNGDTGLIIASSPTQFTVVVNDNTGATAGAVAGSPIAAGSHATDSQVAVTSGTSNNVKAIPFTAAGQIAWLENSPVGADSCTTSCSGTITAFSEGVVADTPFGGRELGFLTETNAGCNVQGSESPLHDIALDGQFTPWVHEGHLEESFGAGIAVGENNSTQGVRITRMSPVTFIGEANNGLKGGSYSRIASFEPYAIKLSNNFGAVLNATLEDNACLDGALSTSATNYSCIADQFNGNILSKVNNPISNYWTDGSGVLGGVFTNANPVDMVNGIDMYAGILGFYNGTINTPTNTINHNGTQTFFGSTSGSTALTESATGSTFRINGAGGVSVLAGGVAITSGNLFSWNGDTGLSRDSAGVVDVGNGSVADISGTVKANIFNAGTGFEIGGTAAAGNVLQGNGSNFVSAVPGVPVNAQTGTSYTIKGTGGANGNGDRGNYVSFSNGSAIAVTLPQAGTANFNSGFVLATCDIGTGTATITPTTSNISWTDGSAYHSAQTSLPLTTGQCAWVYSDNSNYFAILRGAGGGGGVTSIATTSPITGGTITTTGTIGCATCVTSSGGGADTGVSPIAITAAGAISLQNSTPANVTAAYGTDTAYFTASGGASTTNDVIVGDAQGGIADSGVLITNLTRNTVSGTTNVLPKFSAAHTVTNSTVTDNGTVVSTTEPFTSSFNGTASQSTLYVTGTPFTGGTATTNFPLFYLNSGASGPTHFSLTGTMEGINAPSGFTGNVVDYSINGGPAVFQVTYQGNEIITQTSGATTALNITNSTAATSSVAQSSPFDIRSGQFWLNYFPSSSGFIAAATQTDCWSHQVVETNGTNGPSIYQMIHNSAADNCQGSPSNSYLQAPFAASWGVQTNTLSQPSTPVITHAGTGGAATWTYTIVAAVGPTFTQASASGSTATGNATLTTGNYNIITWSVTPNADYYLVYRTVSGGTPATLGVIAAVPSGSTASGASCSASTCVVNDEALVGDTTAAPAYNSTGQVYVGTGPAVGGGTGGGMFSVGGTAPTTLSGSAAGWYASAAPCFDIVNGTTDKGCVSTGQTIALTADWTCGTGGTVASCVAAQTIGTLSFTLPLAAQNWSFDCNLLVDDATGTPTNNWTIQTASHGATNLMAAYQMNTAAAVVTSGAVTGQASTTSSVDITGTWALGATGTKMPAHIWGTIEGASASGTVFNMQVKDPTVGDLLTIYRGSECRVF